MKLWNDTIKQLEEWASEHDSALIAYSGGKDSLAIMDLACRCFKHVTAFHMYFVPGLRVIEDQIKLAEDRWEIPIVQIPHFTLIHSLRAGLFCDESEAHAKLPVMNLKDVYAWMLHLTGIELLLTGARNSDGLQRRQFFENVERQAKKGDTIWQTLGYPIRAWKKRDVVAYLNAHDIPLPPQPKGNISSGIGLTQDIAEWLSEDYPDDWEKIQRWFPYAGAMIARKEMFGIG